jgi:hypothetical protein
MPDGRVVKRSAVVNACSCLILLIQFLLGMVVNLFMNVPIHHPGADAHNFFTGITSAIGWVVPDGPAWLAAHVTFGLALIVAALANLAWASSMRSKAYSSASMIGALAIVGAAFNGISFVNYRHNFSSMIMSALWALAISSYLICLIIAAYASLARSSSTPKSVPRADQGQR